jgi:hypothetical protein
MIISFPREKLAGQDAVSRLHQPHRRKGFSTQAKFVHRTGYAFQPCRPRNELRLAIFRTLMGSFLLKHPLANVSRAIHNVNAECLTLIQQTNSIEINNVDLVQVQSLRPSELFEFGAQINEMRTPKFT